MYKKFLKIFPAWIFPVDSLLTFNLQSNLRPIETFTISPTEDLSTLAGEYFSELPKLLKFFFKRVGIDGEEGSTVLSYLLFESAYTRRLISLGYKDAIKQSEKIAKFFEID